MFLMNVLPDVHVCPLRKDEPLLPEGTAPLHLAA